MIGVLGIIIDEIASVIQVINHEVAVAEVKRQTFCQLVTKACEGLVSESCFRVIDRVDRETRLRRRVEEIVVPDTCRHFGNADTSTEIRLELAVTIEIIKQVQHGIPAISLTAWSNNRVLSWTETRFVKSLTVHRWRNVKFGVTESHSTFKTEAIVEAVAKTGTVCEVAFDVAVVTESTRNVSIRIVVELAVKVVANIAANVPAVLSISCPRHHRESDSRRGAQKSFFHTHPLV